MEPTQPNQPAASPAESEDKGPLSRRGFLGVAGAAGLTAIAASVAACQSNTTPAWSFGPAAGGGAATAAPASAAPATAAPATAAPATAAPSPSADPNIPEGWTSHDVAAREVVRRYVGNLAPAIKSIFDPVDPAIFTKLAGILGAEENPVALTEAPSWLKVPQVYINDIAAPLKPTRMDGDVAVYDMTIDEIFQSIDDMKAPVAALGYNKQWPGPTIHANVGDKLQFNFTNNLKETTGVHFHGVEFQNFFEDGVPFVTQLPIKPGETFTYNITASRPGSLMYHSHHNATDQVGRGLLGAFVVHEPKAEKRWDSEYNWISNDALGGFTINGHGFPAVVPVVAHLGERVLLRFMNEGTMMHPWHTHGYRMQVIARDGYPLGSAEFGCDTLGVNPGERWDAIVTCDRPGIWAWHCHILPHVEGTDGMFGMVNTLIVVPTPEDKQAVFDAVVAGYKPA